MVDDRFGRCRAGIREPETSRGLAGLIRRFFTPSSVTWAGTALAVLASAFWGSPIDAQQGTIVGRVSFESPSVTPRRTAGRYPGGATASHAIQVPAAVVYLTGAGVPPAAPDTTTMAQRDTAFVPSMVVVGVGGVVEFPNADPFFHNVFSYSSVQRFDLGRYPQGESKGVSFPEPGIVEVFCEVHEFMRGAVLVAPTPFHAIIAADGTFRIANVPPGEHTLAFWHADFEPIQRRVMVTAGATTRVDVELRR